MHKMFKNKAANITYSTKELLGYEHFLCYY